MRFTMHTVQGYLVRTHVGGMTHLLTTAEENVGLELGDEVELLLPGESVPVKATVVGFIARVDEPR